MAAHRIVDLEVTDATRFAEYRERGPATVAAQGGRVLLGGDAHEVVEGGWRPRRLVVPEFPSLAQAGRWYDSDEYRALRAMRLAASDANLVFADGV
jgi:uncharacterized protein (DUF1330 family)